MMQNEFSGEADEIYDKYNEEEVHWEIILSNQDIEKQIEHAQAVIDRESSKRSLMQASGETLRPDDYRDAIY